MVSAKGTDAATDDVLIYFLKITSDFYAEELQIKMLSQPKGIQESS